ncbi:MAG: hypothetical protein JJU29_01155 [Verrucomicrobia bacterium]|nr:hypothetical protein [Verrucomicrobiota bacterium]MCH8510485.1 hypothetical protein [Kiritimatiellia bacterium]
MNPLEMQIHPHYPEALKSKQGMWNDQFKSLESERQAIAAAARKAVSRLASGDVSDLTNDLEAMNAHRGASLRLDAEELALMIQRGTFAEAVESADREEITRLHNFIQSRETDLRKKHADLPPEAVEVIVKQDAETIAAHRQVSMLNGADTHRRNFVSGPHGDTHPAKLRPEALRKRIIQSASDLFEDERRMKRESEQRREL